MTTETLTPFRQRERCKAILSSPEAQGREALAKHLALETDMPTEQALTMLRSANKESTSRPRHNVDMSGLWGSSEASDSAGLQSIHAKVYEQRRKAMTG